MLTLIGVSHVDFEGYARLTNALQTFNPDVVALETTTLDFLSECQFYNFISESKGYAHVRQKLSTKFPEANQEMLTNWINSLCFETRAIHRYILRTGAKLVFADSQKVLATVDFEGEARTPDSPLVRVIEKMLKLTPEQHTKEVAEEYAMTTYPVIDNPELTKFYSNRDAHTEKVLREQKSNSTVYVAGLDHLFGDYHPNLADRLRDVKPEVLRLNKF